MNDEVKLVDILDNISTLTSVNRKALNKLSDVTSYCIVDAVHETNLKFDKITEVDIGIGIIKIKIDGDNVKFAFIPSAKLEEGIINSILNRENVLDIALENNLKDKLVNTYKELV